MAECDEQHPQHERDRPDYTKRKQWRDDRVETPANHRVDDDRDGEAPADEDAHNDEVRLSRELFG